MEFDQIQDQLENHLLVAIDEAMDDVSCQDCFDRGEADEDGDECESTSIEAINQALMKLRTMQTTLEAIVNELTPAREDADNHIKNKDMGYPGAVGMLTQRIKWSIERAQRELAPRTEFEQSEWPAS